MKILTKENTMTFVLTALACAVAFIVVIPLWTSIKSKVAPAATTPAAT